MPRGGPDGGDGGAGGSVYLVADPHRNTLLHFRYNPEHRAERGQGGAGVMRTGRKGKDLEIPVPPGTTVLVADHELPGEWLALADLTVPGQRVCVAKGGRGGLGNAHFVTSTNRAPRKVQPGEPGEEKRLKLKLKLLADVGLVGFPNAGQIHAHRPGQRGPAEDRRLPLHHAHAQSRRGQPERRPHLRDCRRARSHRGRARRPRAGTPVPASRRAHGGARSRRRPVGRDWPRSGRRPRRRPPGTRALRPGDARQAAARRRQQARRARRTGTAGGAAARAPPNWGCPACPSRRRRAPGVGALLEAAWPFVAEAKAAYARQLEAEAAESGPAPSHDR